MRALRCPDWVYHSLSGSTIIKWNYINVFTGVYKLEGEGVTDVEIQIIFLAKYFEYSWDAQYLLGVNFNILYQGYIYGLEHIQSTQFI